MGAERPRGILHDADAALDGFGRPSGLDAQVVSKMGDGLLANREENRYRNDQADDDDGERGMAAPAGMATPPTDMPPRQPPPSAPATRTNPASTITSPKRRPRTVTAATGITAITATTTTSRP